MNLRNLLHFFLQAIKLLLVITLIRAGCLVFIKDQLQGENIKAALIMGMRFDWLVISFILILPWVLTVLFEFGPKIFTKFQFLSIWVWRVLSGLALGVWICNTFYFSHQKEWMWKPHWRNRLQEQTGLTLTIFFCVFLALFLFRDAPFLFWREKGLSHYSTRKKIYGAKRPRNSVDATEPDNIATKIFVVMISALILAMGARGTVTPHHLGFEHSRATRNNQINDWVLSPLWTMTKPIPDAGPK